MHGPHVAVAATLTMVTSAFADPATSYCESRGGKVVIESATDGVKTISCVFHDGSRVNAAAYFRSTHRTTK